MSGLSGLEGLSGWRGFPGQHKRNLQDNLNSLWEGELHRCRLKSILTWTQGNMWEAYRDKLWWPDLGNSWMMIQNCSLRYNKNGLRNCRSSSNTQ